jgi:hypothetical protein
MSSGGPIARRSCTFRFVSPSIESHRAHRHPSKPRPNRRTGKSSRLATGRSRRTFRAFGRCTGSGSDRMHRCTPPRHTSYWARTPPTMLRRSNPADPRRSSPKWTNSSIRRPGWRTSSPHCTRTPQTPTTLYRSGARRMRPERHMPNSRPCPGRTSRGQLPHRTFDPAYNCWCMLPRTWHSAPSPSTPPNRYTATWKRRKGNPARPSRKLRVSARPDRLFPPPGKATKRMYTRVNRPCSCTRRLHSPTHRRRSSRAPSRLRLRRRAPSPCLPRERRP